MIVGRRPAPRLGPGRRRTSSAPSSRSSLGTAAFAALGLFVAGVLRAEATLAAANLIYLLLLAGGAVVLPSSSYGAFGHVTALAALRRARRRHAARLPRRRASPGATSACCSSGPRSAPSSPRGRSSGSEPPRPAVAAAARAGPPSSRTSLLVVTGGAVRLTGSGLGCPTWPRCNDASFTPHGDDRAAPADRVRQPDPDLRARRDRGRDLRRRAPGSAAGRRPAAAVGGAGSGDPGPGGARRHHRAHRPQPVGRLAPPGALAGDRRRSRCSSCTGSTTRPSHRPRGVVPALAWTTYAVTWLVLYAGTVVTGSGPHAGDAELTAQRPRPAPGQPVPRRPGVPADRPHRRACGSRCGPTGGDVRPVTALARGRGGCRRRSGSCSTSPGCRSPWSCCTCSARPGRRRGDLAAGLACRGAGWRRRPPTDERWTTIGLHPRGQANRRTCYRRTRGLIGCLRSPISRGRGQRVSSGSSATATNSSER